jgi:hypothetical protein
MYAKKERRMEMHSETRTSDTATRVVWGVEAIAAEIGRAPRAVYHMLESGHLPGAVKFGNRWSFRPADFHAAFSAGQAVAA